MFLHARLHGVIYALSFCFLECKKRNQPFYSAVGYADVDTFHFCGLVVWFATCENFCRFLFLWCGL